MPLFHMEKEAQSCPRQVTQIKKQAESECQANGKELKSIINQENHKDYKPRISQKKILELFSPFQYP